MGEWGRGRGRENRRQAPHSAQHRARSHDLSRKSRTLNQLSRPGAPKPSRSGDIMTRVLGCSQLCSPPRTQAIPAPPCPSSPASRWSPGPVLLPGHLTPTQLHQQPHASSHFSGLIPQNAKDLPKLVSGDLPSLTPHLIPVLHISPLAPRKVKPLLTALSARYDLRGISPQSQSLLFLLHQLPPQHWVVIINCPHQTMSCLSAPLSSTSSGAGHGKPGQWP